MKEKIIKIFHKISKQDNMVGRFTAKKLNISWMENDFKEKYNLNYSKNRKRVNSYMKYFFLAVFIIIIYILNSIYLKTEITSDSEVNYIFNILAIEIGLLIPYTLFLSSFNNIKRDNKEGISFFPNFIEEIVLTSTRVKEGLILIFLTIISQLLILYLFIIREFVNDFFWLEILYSSVIIHLLLIITIFLYSSLKLFIITNSNSVQIKKYKDYSKLVIRNATTESKLKNLINSELNRSDLLSILGFGEGKKVYLNDKTGNKIRDYNIIKLKELKEKDKKLKVIQVGSKIFKNIPVIICETTSEINKDDIDNFLRLNRKEDHYNNLVEIIREITIGYHQSLVNNDLKMIDILRNQYKYLMIELGRESKDIQVFTSEMVIVDKLATDIKYDLMNIFEDIDKLSFYSIKILLDSLLEIMGQNLGLNNEIIFKIFLNQAVYAFEKAIFQFDLKRTKKMDRLVEWFPLRLNEHIIYLDIEEKNQKIFIIGIISILKQYYVLLSKCFKLESYKLYKMLNNEFLRNINQYKFFLDDKISYELRNELESNLDILNNRFQFDIILLYSNKMIIAERGLDKKIYDSIDTLNPKTFCNLFQDYYFNQYDLPGEVVRFFNEINTDGYYFSTKDLLIRTYLIWWCLSENATNLGDSDIELLLLRVFGDIESFILNRFLENLENCSNMDYLWKEIEKEELDISVIIDGKTSTKETQISRILRLHNEIAFKIIRKEENKINKAVIDDEKVINIKKILIDRFSEDFNLKNENEDELYEKIEINESFSIPKKGLLEEFSDSMDISNLLEMIVTDIKRKVFDSIYQMIINQKKIIKISTEEEIKNILNDNNGIIFNGINDMLNEYPDSNSTKTKINDIYNVKEPCIFWFDNRINMLFKIDLKISSDKQIVISKKKLKLEVAEIYTQFDFKIRLFYKMNEIKFFDDKILWELMEEKK